MTWCRTKLRYATWRYMTSTTIPHDGTQHDVMLLDAMLRDMTIHDVIPHDVTLHNVMLHNAMLRDMTIHDVIPLDVTLHNVMLHDARLDDEAVATSRGTTFLVGKRTRLWAEVLELGRVRLMQHGRVAARATQLRVGLIEQLVPTLEEVDLWVVEHRVALLVVVTVSVTQKSRPATTQSWDGNSSKLAPMRYS